MSISPSGRDVVLGSKEGLHIIDLDSPYSPPRFLPHRTPWEVADVQWSPFADRDYWVASTSNQKALVWNLEARGWRNSIEYVLHGHTRAITDINFSAHHKDKLATCAVDSFVHCWDLRTPDRPVISFSDWFAGATQVKWNRQDEHVVASSHDKFLHIWDDRKGAYPARTIEAHNTKIYGIDWNRFEPSKIVTCSLDKTIKFWDINNDEDIPERTIETSFPVWRARHTPFGWGLMVMPQRGNGNLHLYSRRPVDGASESGFVEPVQVFPGHKGQVKEFLWRGFGTVKEGVDHRDFQLVSWGTDRELRLHAVSKKTFNDVGYEKGVSRPQRIRFTRRGARYRTFRDERQEFDSPFTAPPRSDSFPASIQFQRAKGRASMSFGMSKTTPYQFRGWLQPGRRDQRTGMHGKGVVRPDTDPISWMKNVKIASTDTDALADEITHVGDKFKKVEFEAVDMSQRKVTLSLQSPWGDQGASVYTRVDFRFPKIYPKEARAILHLQRTNSISPEVHKKISSDIQSIAEAYLSRGRGCVEAVVRYLLREQSLEQVVNWIMRDAMTDSKIIEAANMADDDADDSEDDQLEAVPNVNNASGENRVPLAKRCGAMWSEGGKLVCFFLPKNTEPASLLSTLGTGQLDEPESGRLFGGFGRFQIVSPPRKPKAPSSMTADGPDSDTSDEESLFFPSSSSSDSSTEFDVQAKFVPWQQRPMNSLQRSKSADGSQKSTILEGLKAAETSRNAFWVIHDLSELLPSKQVTAQDYQVNGDISTLCDRNAQVAASNMQEDIASVWRLVALTLNRPSSHQISETIRTNPDLLVLTKRIRMTAGDLPTILKSLDHVFTSDDGRLLGVLQSGSLVGMLYLVPALLGYFERIGDVQMLAMLSAVFILAQEGVSMETLKKSRVYPEDSTVRISASGVDTSSQAVDHGIARGDNSLQQGGSEAFRGLNLNILDATNGSDGDLNATIPATALYPGCFDNSQASSRAPSVVAHDPGGFISTIHSTSGSIAGSPENHRNNSRRSEVSTATASLFALTKSNAGSPIVQVVSPEKPRPQRSSKSLKTSPEESYLNDSKTKLRSSLSLVNVAGYQNEALRNVQLGQGRVKSILKHSDNNPSVQKLAKKKKKLKTRFTNVASFSSEQQPSPIILSVDMYPRCLNYIKQYITLLEVWRLWPQRAEMQQILTRTSVMLEKLLHDGSGLPKPMIVEEGLQIRRCCQTCGQALVPIEKNGIPIGWDCISEHCTSNISRPSKQQICSICEICVEGLSIPCMQCSHLTCYDCAQGWFTYCSTIDRKRSNSSTVSTSRSHTTFNDENLQLTCPTGCGCCCATLTFITILHPTTVHDEPNEPFLAPPPLTPRSEGYQESSSPHPFFPSHETRPNRGQSVSGADNTALSALLALNLNRTRSVSSSKTGSTVVPGAESGGGERGRGAGNGRRTRDTSISIVDELLPWAGDQNVSLGRGVGAGLSRGLRNMGSDATIRKL